MNHMYVVYSSSKEIFEKFEAYRASNATNVITNEFDIIPNFIAPNVDFIYTGAKFKDCKDYLKKNIDVSKFEEVLFDGSIDDVSVVFQNTDIMYWIIRVPVNRFLTSYVPHKNEVHLNKGNFIVFVQAKNNSHKIFLGIANTVGNIFNIVRKSMESGNLICNKLNLDDKEGVIFENEFVVYSYTRI